MRARRLGLALLVLMRVGGLSAQNALVQRLITTGRHPSMRWGVLSDVQGELRRLYTPNGWLPLWVARGRPTRAGRELLDALATAGARGLDPQDYDAAQLAALAATLERGGADAEQAARFDVALSAGALRFVRALARGRAAPRENPTDGITRAAFDPTAVVAQLRGSVEPGPILAALEPQWAPYQMLLRALSRYRALARDSAALRLPRPEARGVQIGERYAGAARLRQLLVTLGDLGPRAADREVEDSVFTAELADGIRRFQVRQGIWVDGRLDETTWRVLTSPPHYATRIHQMELALERWRWLPRELEALGGDALLFVSVPALRLHYLVPASGDRQPLSMGVRLGGAPGRETPVRAGALTMVMLRPADRRLGTVLFPVAEDPDWFLHGSTPADPFEVAAGSIRVADAELLAALLLRDRPDWPLERIHVAMGGGKPVFVRLRHSVPVLVVYGTAVARENGQVFFYPDAEGQDRWLERRLARGYPY